jgi:hypothetical protein
MRSKAQQSERGEGNKIQTFRFLYEEYSGLIKKQLKTQHLRICFADRDIYSEDFRLYYQEQNLRSIRRF